MRTPLVKEDGAVTLKLCPQWDREEPVGRDVKSAEFISKRPPFLLDAQQPNLRALPEPSQLSAAVRIFYDITPAPPPCNISD